MRNVRKMWSRLWNQPCFVRFKKLRRGEACGEKTKHSQIKICMRRRSSRIYVKALGENSTKDHEYRIAENGIQFIESVHLVHKFIPLTRAMKMPNAKAVVDKEWEKVEKLPAWQMTKVRGKKEAIQEAQKVLR